MSYFQDLDKDTKRHILSAWNLLVKSAREDIMGVSTENEMYAVWTLNTHKMQYPIKTGHGR